MNELIYTTPADLKWIREGKDIHIVLPSREIKLHLTGIDGLCWDLLINNNTIDGVCQRISEISGLGHSYAETAVHNFLSKCIKEGLLVKSD